MRTLYCIAVIVLIVLLTGTAQARPVDVQLVDYDCDAEITVADVLMVVSHNGSTEPVDLWAYDLDHSGSIDAVDGGMVIPEIGTLLTEVAPVWCER